jgi:coenzyme PQQ synthesis protein D (PqqD)
VVTLDIDSDASLLAARAVVPEHVAQREFAEQSIAVNLQTGEYHGLNPTAARMVVILGERGTVADAIQPLASEFDQSPEVIERDLLGLCRMLAERGLIELHADAG